MQNSGTDERAINHMCTIWADKKDMNAEGRTFEDRKLREVPYLSRYVILEQFRKKPRYMDECPGGHPQEGLRIQLLRPNQVQAHLQPLRQAEQG
ncbi:hypothetical protein PVIIG_02516 [Plasmodium vivax India VII]|uniref:Uncharacterized protein n=1 Tax=Plasmodium vivax India VII TaxID=1077284 RepID=A0A0J9SJF2_PLAVI|nr:hypothetical protein PVIIG_02516 [Plasmodium vivax India VII]